MQRHWSLNYPFLDEVEKAIEMYAELGVKVMITVSDNTVFPSPPPIVGVFTIVVNLGRKRVY